MMHAETLAYLIHNLPASAKRAPAQAGGAPATSAVAPHVVRIPAGHATLGAPRDGRFGWDNEFDLHVVEVPAFGIDALDVTNGQYLDFVRAGGYDDERLWTPEDWAWRARAGLRHPLFWRRTDQGWMWRGMFGERPLPLDTPVWVSYAEASAYARWKGRRLPTEAEFHRAAYGTPDGSERHYPWGDEAPTAQHGNFDFHRWDPTPAGAHAAGRSAFGVYDLLGNGWEWTSTVFAPFEGFEVYPPYRGYSADFFDGRHVVMKGGSPRTAASMLRRSFRNWFQPRYPYVFASFRLVEP
jgi:gamma-glutamyl hercynylcysteine S-oxide synthase